MSSYALDTMKWELADNKQVFILESLDKSLQITVQSKQVGTRDYSDNEITYIFLQSRLHCFIVWQHK